MKGKYKRTQGWCHKCDAEIVVGGMRCPNCGTRYIISKQKKPTIDNIIKKYYNVFKTLSDEDSN